MKAKTLIVGGAVSVAAGVGIFAVSTLWMAGSFKTIEPHGTEGCATIEGFSGGTEDFIDRPDGTLFVSSPDFRDAEKGGRIFHVDVDAKTVRDVTPELGFSFQPHGVSLWVDDEVERLFVVNHRGGSALPDAADSDAHATVHTIEIFDVASDGSLTHASSVRSDALVSPNDVAAVGRDAFYATNDHGYAAGIMRTLEDFLRLPAGDVVYGDGDRVRSVWSGSRYANGVVASRDGKSVFVAETTGFLVRRFERDLATGDLTPASSFDLGTGPDNLNLDADGNLWTGAHPKLFAFIEHSEDPDALSPSQVLRITPGPDWSVDEVWLDEGDLMSGSSVAWTNGDQVVTGAVFQGRLVVCPQ